jgi:D-glycero-D-manno-heptose 1,7-bisphosphate phosphatase
LDSIFRKSKFVALDRDGTIIAEREYLSHPGQVELLPGAAAGLRAMRNLGLRLVIVTNQSGVGRGYFDVVQLEAVHFRLKELLAIEGVSLDGIYYCPHTPEDKCNCRKPRPGMLLQASKDLGFEPSQAVVIGDKALDIELGQNLGANTVLVRTGYGTQVEASGTAKASYVANNLADAAQFIGLAMGIPRRLVQP